MIVEFRQTIGIRTTSVGVCAIDVRLVRARVEANPEGGSKLVGSTILLQGSFTVEVDSGPSYVIEKLNASLRSMRSTA